MPTSWVVDTPHPRQSVMPFIYPTPTVVAGGVPEETLALEQQAVVDATYWAGRVEELHNRATDLYRNVCGDEGREAVIVDMEAVSELYARWDNLVEGAWLDRGHLTWEEIKELEDPGFARLEAAQLQVIMRSLAFRLDRVVAKLEERCLAVTD